MLSLFGLPPQVEAGHDSLPTFLQMYTRPDYTSDAAMIFGTQVENTDLYREQAALASDWNQVYAFPKLKSPAWRREWATSRGSWAIEFRCFAECADPLDIFTAGAPAVLARETEHRALTAEKSPPSPRCVNPRFGRPAGAFAVLDSCSSNTRTTRASQTSQPPATIAGHTTAKAIWRERG